MTVTATVFTSPGQVLLWATVAIAAVILLTWLVSLALHDASVIDPIWGPAFVVVGAVAAVVGTGCGRRRWLLFAMTAVWGLRLGCHLIRRKLSERDEDRRYQAMRQAHSRHFALWSLCCVYAVQGLLVLLVSLPLQVSAQAAGKLGLATVPGLLVYLLGLGFEAIGDEQLRRFKSDPENHGRVMDQGLWRYTRHPNYFGDACVWWGLWLVALPAPGTWWAAIGPAVMTLLLVRVSGKGLLEKDIGQRRPGYGEYVARTSGFIPWPPRRPSEAPTGDD